MIPLVRSYEFDSSLGMALKYAILKERFSSLLYDYQ